MIRFTIFLLTFLTVIVGAPAHADIFHVHAKDGHDGATGTAGDPLRTASEALIRAQPGDTIRLMPGQGLIKESLRIKNRSGRPDAPITIDGGGNWLVGTEPIPTEEWEEIETNLYRNAGFIEKFVGDNPNGRQSFLGRFFLVINGSPSRMNRSSKAARPPWPEPAALQPGQWTYHPADGALYFRTAPDTPLTTYKIEAPVRQDGLAMRGDCHHWVIYDLNVLRFWNDGFNFHGSTRDIRLKNISAVECGDDGMSAHEQCEVTVDGFTARRNSTGICHIEQSSSKNRAVDLQENYSLNLYVLGNGTHEFFDSTIGPGIRAGNPHSQESVTLHFLNCHLPSAENPVEKSPASRVIME